jgi:uncharacterized RDD family membrane protein YckC
VSLRPARAAGILRRTAAAGIDLAILAATAGLLNVLLIALVAPPRLVGARSLPGTLVELALASPRDLVGRVAPALLIAWLYLTIFHSTTGATPGARLLGLRVVNGRGGPPRPVAAATRALACILGLGCAALGPLWAAFDRERRAVHDKLTGTWVVRAASPRSPA